MVHDRRVIYVVAAVIFAEGRILACRRAEHKTSAGKWEFPGGKVEPGESSAEALIREIREELGFEVQPGESLDISVTSVGKASIRLETILCPVEIRFEVSSSDHDSHEWVLPQDLMSFDWALPDLPAVDLLLGGGLTGVGRVKAKTRQTFR
jgi:8-oxo-dGTP diphosphatase